MNAIHDIAAERKRQIEVEGWSPEHDDQHDDETLAIVAALFATPIQLFEQSVSQYGDGTSSVYFDDPWPSNWDGGYDRRNDFDKRKRLVIAGALIAAEIDRIDRASKVNNGENDG